MVRWVIIHGLNVSVGREASEFIVFGEWTLQGCDLL